MRPNEPGNDSGGTRRTPHRCRLASRPPGGVAFLASIAVLPALAWLAAAPVFAQVTPPYFESPPNDARISHMGPDGDTTFGAMWFLVYLPMAPKVAYNSVDDEYLVVWWADDSAGTLADEEFEIWGQRIEAGSGALLGNRIRISVMGPDGDPDYDALYPDLAYNPVDNEYLVVWVGDHSETLLANDEFEVFGRVVDSDGTLLGSQMRISRMGPDGDPAYGVPWWIPAVDVAHNATNDFYLVTWVADTNLTPLVNDEFEIYIRRLQGNGLSYDSDAGVRISSMGPDGSTAYHASEPAVAWDSTHNQFLVVWHGDTNYPPPLADEEFEIWGHVLPGDPAFPLIILDPIRISAMGPDGVAAYGAFSPAVAYNAVDDNYLVVWRGDDDGPPTVDEEFEVWGRKVDWNGTLLDTRLRLSAMGFLDGQAAYDALAPEIAFDEALDQHVVVFAGDDDTFGMVDEEFEVFSAVTSGPSGVTDLLINDRLSDLGPNGNVQYAALTPAVAVGASDALVVWWGDDDSGTAVDDEFEIWAQRLERAAIFADGFESGNLVAWSSASP